MPPIDPSIILGVKQFAPPDPLESYSKVLGLKTLMGQQDLQGLQTQQARQGIEDDNATRDAYAQAGGDSATVRKLLAQRGQYKQVQALDKLLLDNKLHQSTLDKNTAETDASRQQQVIRATTQHRDDLANVSDPQTAAQWVQAGFADPVLAPVLARGGTVQDAIAKIPTDPEAFKQWKAQNALGATKFIELNKPSIHVQDAGGTSNIVAVPGLGGAPTMLSTTAKTQTPDSIASNATSRANALMANGVARERLNFEKSTPQYMETDAGLVALPKKLAPGQVPTGTPVMDDKGQPLGRPLKPLPPAVNEAIIGNAQSLYSLEKAIDLASGKKVDSALGDKNATGWKGYLPQSILNRVDPKGVDTRAEVADIGSLKIHDRSGAAVTISESPRLMPFIPNATDDNPTVIRKLTRLKEEAQRMQTALSDTYSKDQGYKPSPVKPAVRPAGIDPSKMSDSELKRELGL